MDERRQQRWDYQMSLDTDLRAGLAGDAGVSALVGARISSDRIEQGTIRPFITFSRAATEYQTTLDGTVVAERATFDVQVWADTRLSAEAVSSAIKTYLDANQRQVLSRASGYDPELDLEASILSVEWWD